jgi:hypothetical protein
MWRLLNSKHCLTRREFLALSASTTAAAFLAGCNQGPGGTDGEATFFINPGDSRAARYSFEGQSGTLFGPKDNQGGVLNINHARVDALDGDPQNQALLDFAEDGSPSKAVLASGETMSFEWVSASKVIITYRSADGSQEVRFPYDADNPPSLEARPAISYQTRKSLTVAEAAWLEHAAREKHLSRQRGIMLPAQLGNPGTIEVRCGSTAVEGATVTGFVEAANLPGEKLEVSFTETVPGSFSYSLPIAKAPEPGPANYHKQRTQRALNIICLGNLAILLTQASKEYICASLLGVPAVGAVGFAACELILTSYVWLCRLNTAANIGGAAVDFFAGSYVVTAKAQHPKLGQKEVKVNASAGSAIPTGIINFAGAGGNLSLGSDIGTAQQCVACEAGFISSLGTEPIDPAPDQSYVIVAETQALCAEGTQLTLSIIGSDGYANSTTVTLSETVQRASLSVPGAKQGVKDTVTAELTGSFTDTKTLTVTF